MEFRVLGPLEVVEGARVVPIKGAKQRALLAMLLLNAGRVVSADRLLDELWGDEPPESGATALQVRVSQLRKALAEGGAAIKTRPPGYAIELATGQLDLHAFERLLAQADGAEPAVASGLLGEALALWRGAALDDLAYESFAQPAIGRLEELRLVAIERRLDADLALGRHAELVPELETLGAEHPLRERFRAQLMLALYRCGRQGDALAVYQATRRMLVDELGIDPGPALQELESAILRQDPGLRLPTAPPPAGRSILVVPLSAATPDVLFGLGERLARRPPRELILARLVAPGSDLRAASAALHSYRERVAPGGIVARAAVFTSTDPGADLVRLAEEQDADLLLVDAPSALLDDAVLGHVLAAAPCDVAVLVRGEVRSGPVLVPFAGAEHDWAAVELAAWIAGAEGSPLRLAGPAADGGGAGRDASRLLASASLAIQRALGVPAEPLLVAPGEVELLRAADEAALLVVGLSDRWRKDGLGPVRGALAARAAPATVLVRRGMRPGGLAPRESLTRFTWSLASSV
jgi:DNA-binding SARP family transcriptional activator